MTAVVFIFRRLASPVIAVATAWLLAGCGSLDPVVDHTRFYTLSPAVPGTTTNPETPNPARIGVRVTVQPDYLRRSAIAVRTTAHELRLVDDHRWAEGVAEGIARVLAQDLQARVPQALFAPVSGGGMTAGAPLIIDVTVAACEGTGDGAVFEAYWRIDAGAGDTAEHSGHFRDASAGWNGTDYGALAAQLSSLVDQLAAEIATQVAAAVPAP